jgi:hypothetical protein
MGWPTERTPTPEEFIQEGVRRFLEDPEAHLVAQATATLVCAVRNWDLGDPAHREVLEHLRMGALVGLLVRERFDVFLPGEAPMRPASVPPAELRARIEKALSYPQERDR